MSYNEQYDRLKRFYNRIQNHQGNGIDYWDDLFSFFIHCWHLKDWIKNDNSLSEHVRNNIDKIVNTYKNLRIAADIANRAKHLDLNKTKREDAKIVGNDVIISLGKKNSCTYKHHIDLGNGTRLIAQDVATNAMNEWKEIIDTLH